MARVEEVVEAVEQRVRQTYVLGPALAMDRRKGTLCFLLKFSSANLSP